MQCSVVKHDASLAGHSSMPKKPAGDPRRGALKAQLKNLRSSKSQVLSCRSERQKSEDEAETEAGYGAASSQENIMARGRSSESIVHNQAVQCDAAATASIQDVKAHEPRAAEQARLLVANAAKSDTEDTTQVQAAHVLHGNGMKLSFQVKDKELRRKMKRAVGTALDAEAQEAKVHDVVALQFVHLHQYLESIEQAGTSIPTLAAGL